jgi:hypothetical protein
VPSLDLGVQQTQVQVRVEFRDVPGRGTASVEVSSGQFETGDRGVQVGSLFVPWARVLEYDWTVRQEVFEHDGTRDVAKLRVRVVLDDGTPDGAVHDVAADRFESGPFAAMLLIDRHVDADAGVLVIQKLFVPWHRVVSVERYTARPDVAPEPEATSAAADAPSRPDVS